MKKVGVGVIGFGTVGTGVVRMLLEKGDFIARRTGILPELVRVADVDLDRPRPVAIDGNMLVRDAKKLFRDPKIRVIVELIGGLSPAREFILEALDAGKHVVTANKALLAHHGKELLEAARAAGRNLLFEASVGGGIPIVKALREGFVGNQVSSIHGIVNGTANYILTLMQEEEKGFDKALREAQKLGFAEADASLDVDGIDSAHKLVILTYLAYGCWVKLDSIHVEGIRGITCQDLAYAKELGFILKLLVVSRTDGNQVDVRVHPSLLQEGNPLASVNGVYNAFYMKGDFIGESMLYGKGAGERPTASAVISDLVDVAGSPRSGAVFQQKKW